MNIMYLSLYGVAAVVLAVEFIRTCLERDKMTRIVCLTEMLALICVVTYSVNFITDNYMAMSVATSIMMAAQDFALVALLTYTGIFTRLANRITRTAVVLCIFAAMVDSVVFIINIFNETALKYSLNKCGGVYVLGYEGELWFGIHAIMNMVIVAFIIALLIIKCIRIPSAYWGRYIFTAAGLIVIIAFILFRIFESNESKIQGKWLLYSDGTELVDKEDQVTWEFTNGRLLISGAYSEEGYYSIDGDTLEIYPELFSEIQSCMGILIWSDLFPLVYLFRKKCNKQLSYHTYGDRRFHSVC